MRVSATATLASARLTFHVDVSVGHPITRNPPPWPSRACGAGNPSRSRVIPWRWCTPRSLSLPYNVARPTLAGVTSATSGHCPADHPIAGVQLQDAITAVATSRNATLLPLGQVPDGYDTIGQANGRHGGKKTLTTGRPTVRRRPRRRHRFRRPRFRGPCRRAEVGPPSRQMGMTAGAEVRFGRSAEDELVIRHGIGVLQRRAFTVVKDDEGSSRSERDDYAMVSCDIQVVRTKPPLCQECAKTGKHSPTIRRRSGTRTSAELGIGGCYGTARNAVDSLTRFYTLAVSSSISRQVIDHLSNYR